MGKGVVLGVSQSPPYIKAVLLDFHECYQLPKALSALILQHGPPACDVPDMSKMSKKQGCFLSAVRSHCLRTLLLSVFCPLIN